MCEVRERTGWDWDKWLVVLTGRSLTLSHLSEYCPDELTSRMRDRISARLKHVLTLLALGLGPLPRREMLSFLLM